MIVLSVGKLGDNDRSGDECAKVNIRRYSDFKLCTGLATAALIA
jgi:hypothetical protein